MNKAFLLWLARGSVAAGALMGSLLAQAQTTPYITISSTPSPLSIFLGDELSMQVNHSGDTVHEIYPPTTTPGDFGTFAVINGTLYAPNFAQHGISATNNIGAYIPFTPVSQTGVTGSGMAADPYQVVTTVNADATNISITQTVTYVTGNEYFDTSTVLTNSGAVDQTVLLYRAMDCYMGDSDQGYGYVDTASNLVACTQNPDNNPTGRIEGMYSLSPGSSYMEDNYGNIWVQIGSHQPFPNTAQPNTQLDNGLGHSWSVTVPANSSITLLDRTTFSPTGNFPPLPPSPPPPPQEPTPPEPIPPTPSQNNPCSASAPVLNPAALALLALLFGGAAAMGVQRKKR